MSEGAIHSSFVQLGFLALSSPHNSWGAEAKSRKVRAGKVSLTREGSGGIVVHYAEEPEWG